MKFRILGQLQVYVNGRWGTISAPKVRLLLAVLLINTNRLVSADRLRHELWPNAAPPSAAKLLQIYVSQLRRGLGDHDGTLLLTQHPGYLLVTADSEVDSRQFEELLASGRRALAAGEAPAAVRYLDQALALWRGSVLDDVPDGELIEAVVARLEESRTVAEELRLEALLRCGRHDEARLRLKALVAAHPFRERLRELQMIALYRSGRQVEALTVARELREQLLELGLEPRRSLRDLEQAILAEDPALDAPDNALAVTGGRAVPRQLPPVPAEFTGRDHDVQQLHRLLAPDQPVRRPPVVVIRGGAGTGKSTLAIWVAHQLDDRFPDGCLYADFTWVPAAPGPDKVQAILSCFIRALSPSARVHGELIDAIAQYRSLLANRKVLVVLDNVRTASQMTSLLPSGPGCAALVTSRSPLTTLQGAEQWTLGPLVPDEAVALLAKLAGSERFVEDKAAAVNIAEFCGNLPLALRIVGARLAARPNRTLRAQAQVLADESYRLDELTLDDLSVRASFRRTYQDINERDDLCSVTAAKLFRLLGTRDSDTTDPATSAVLLDLPEPIAEAALERLADDHLVEPSGKARYRIPPLLHLFAHECARRED